MRYGKGIPDWAAAGGKQGFRAAFMVLLGASLCASAAKGQVTLSWIRSNVLQKTSGSVDQAVPLPNGGFVIRDHDLRNEENQAIEIFDERGRFIRKVGKFGEGPGQYFRLTSVAISDDGTIWATDLMGRLMRYGSSGQLLGTTLIQRPSYRVTSLALDEKHGAFYLAGCLPKEYYLNLGCTLVHQYTAKDSRYRRSFLETDKEAVEKNLLPFESYRLDVDDEGNIYAVDCPILKLFRIDPRSARIETLPIKSRVIRSVEALPLGQRPEFYHDAHDKAFLADRVLVSGSAVAVSIRRPHPGGYVLEIFNRQGHQVGVDVDSPGELVGKGAFGSLFFVSKKGNAFEVAEYNVLGTF